MEKGLLKYSSLQILKILLPEFYTRWKFCIRKTIGHPSIPNHKTNVPFSSGFPMRPFTAIEIIN